MTITPRLAASRVHATADVSPSAQIGDGCQIWNNAQVREGAVLGDHCIVGKDAYVDAGVEIGRNVKVQNGALIYHGATVEEGVFVGPQVCLTNDRFPRAINPDGSLKSASDWTVSPIRVKYGASLGARSVVLAGVTIGCFAMVGAGSVVTHDVPDYGLVAGVPARLLGYVCACGQRLVVEGKTGWCSVCGRETVLEGAPE